MLVLGITETDIMKWCQITNNGIRRTCPTKIINGELFFKFKKAWHPVARYVSEHAEVLLEERGKVISKPFKTWLAERR